MQWKGNIIKIDFLLTHKSFPKECFNRKDFSSVYNYTIYQESFFVLLKRIIQECIMNTGNNRNFRTSIITIVITQIIANRKL